MKFTPAICLLSVLLSACGYHVVGGKASTLPKGIDTIAVQPFSSNVDQYNLSGQLAQAISHEFTTRTQYHVVPSVSDADAILTGAIRGLGIFPTVSDPNTGRSTSVGIQLVLDVRLEQRSTGKILYERDNLAVRDYYEIATDPHQTFIESGPAYDRISRIVARDVVASILDNF